MTFFFVWFCNTGFVLISRSSDGGVVVMYVFVVFFYLGVTTFHVFLYVYVLVVMMFLRVFMSASYVVEFFGKRLMSLSVVDFVIEVSFVYRVLCGMINLIYDFVGGGFCIIVGAFFLVFFRIYDSSFDTLCFIRCVKLYTLSFFWFTVR